LGRASRQRARCLRERLVDDPTRLAILRRMALPGEMGSPRRARNPLRRRRLWHPPGCNDSWNPAWSYMWRRLVPAITGSGHRALAFDLMGFGKSDKPNPDLHDFPHHARIVSSYIESLGLRNLILIVHDWGGPLAMQYVIRHQQN